jgi:uncharacterized membrane protein
VRRDTLIAAGALAAIPIVILSLAVLCTYAEAHGASPLLRLPFRLICHGIRHRCLFLFGTRMPICSRCVGIYLGLFAGIAAFLVMPWVRERVLRVAASAAALLMFADGFTQLLRLRESTNTLRLATGFPFAFLFVMWALSAIERRDERVFTTS